MQKFKVLNRKPRQYSRMKWPLLHKAQSQDPQAVLPIDGLTKHLDEDLIHGDISVFEEKCVNDVLLEAGSQLKSGYPTIATSSMVARRNRRALEEVDNATDEQFFTDLEKAMQYRWKFQKEKIKTIAPSKHGFHQRSKSPTFQRLVKANEKLQTVVSQYTDEVDNVTVRDFFDTQSPKLPVKPSSVLMYVKSEHACTGTDKTSSIPAIKDTALEQDNDLKPEARTIEPSKKSKESFMVQNNASGIEENRSTSPINESSPPPHRKPAKTFQKNFEVHFKTLDTRSELHLFLPQIHDSISRGETPEEPRKKGNLRFSLPAIEDLEIKMLEEDTSKSKKRYKHEHKKKKKHSHRVKSGIEEKKEMDMLNDIPTLISLETDKDFHSESMCMLKNCKLHRHRKSNRIRQA